MMSSIVGLIAYVHMVLKLFVNTRSGGICHTMNGISLPEGHGPPGWARPGGTLDSLLSMHGLLLRIGQPGGRCDPQPVMQQRVSESYLQDGGHGVISFPSATHCCLWTSFHWLSVSPPSMCEVRCVCLCYVVSQIPLQWHNRLVAYLLWTTGLVSDGLVISDSANWQTLCALQISKISNLNTSR